MSEHHHPSHGAGPEVAGRNETLLRRGRWVFWAFAAIAAVFLITEHRAHLLGVLPFLLIAACPRMHMFMHGGHGGHGNHTGDPANRREQPENARKWE